MTPQHFNIQITGIGLSCATQNLPFEMFDSLSSTQVISPDNSDSSRVTNKKNQYETVTSCPIEHLENCEDSNDRLLLNTIMALENAFESAELNTQAETLYNKKCLIYIVTPENNHTAKVDFGIDEWYDVFTDEDSLLADYLDPNNINIKFEQYSDSATDRLSRLCEQLSEGEWDTIFFGGVDSFQSHPDTNGGVAFLVLETLHKNNTIQRIQPIIYINNSDNTVDTPLCPYLVDSHYPSLFSTVISHKRYKTELFTNNNNNSIVSFYSDLGFGFSPIVNFCFQCDSKNISICQSAVNNRILQFDKQNSH